MAAAAAVLFLAYAAHTSCTCLMSPAYVCTSEREAFRAVTVSERRSTLCPMRLISAFCWCSCGSAGSAWRGLRCDPSRQERRGSGRGAGGCRCRVIGARAAGATAPAPHSLCMVGLVSPTAALLICGRLRCACLVHCAHCPSGHAVLAGGAVPRFEILLARLLLLYGYLRTFSASVPPPPPRLPPHDTQQRGEAQQPHTQPQPCEPL